MTTARLSAIFQGLIHNRVGKKITVGLVLTLTGCVNPYAKYYRSNHYADGNTPPKVEPDVERTEDLNGLTSQLISSGYTPLGQSDFEGAIASDWLAKSQARKVGADIVGINLKYLRSLDLNMPVTTFQPGTTYSTSFQGNSGTQPFQGQAYTTTPGNYQTEYVPIHQDRYEQHAVFFRKVKREE